MENLRAMGCNPAAIDGETVKVNAPPVPKINPERIGNNEKTENKKA